MIIRIYDINMYVTYKISDIKVTNVLSCCLKVSIAFAEDLVQHFRSVRRCIEYVNCQIPILLIKTIIL